MKHKFTSDWTSVPDKWRIVAGVVLLTEEALELVQASRFLDVLRTQAPWSELPLIILTSGGESRRAELLDLAAAAAGDRDFAGAAHQFPDADAFGAGGITFSPAAIPGAGSRQATGESEPNVSSSESPSARPKRSNAPKNSVCSLPNYRSPRSGSGGASRRCYMMIFSKC